MAKEVTYIGIDPDVDLNGVGRVDIPEREVSVASLHFTGVLDYLEKVREQVVREGRDLVVIVEAGWKNGGNWHLHPKDSRASAASKGYDVGRNHQVGILLVEYLEDRGFDVVEQRPLAKCWKGKDGKITHDEIVYFTKLAKGRSNAEERDALLLAWAASGLPIKMKV